MEAVAGFLAVFFVMGGFWFWVTTVAWFAIVLACAENEQNFWAAVTVGLFAWGFMSFNQVNINWSLVPWFIVGYFAAGGVWSFVKWLSFLHQRADEYVRLKMKFAQDYAGALPPITEDTNMKEALAGAEYATAWNRWKGSLRSQRFITSSNPKVIPSAKDKTETIITWILWWPTSMLWTLLNDPLVRLARWMVRRLSSWYDGLAAKIFAGAGVGAGSNDEDYNG